jgi:GNAT superfamily N-acetyltransferase
MKSPNYEIREAVTSDAEGVAAVHVKSWQTSYAGIIDQSYLDNISYNQRFALRKKILASEGSLQLVVTFDGQIVGFADAGPMKLYNEQLSLFKDKGVKRGEIYAIYLLEEHKGKGMGRALYQHCKCWFSYHGFQQFITWGLADNMRAKHFYESEGGEIIGEVSIEIGDKSYLEFCYFFTR